MLKTLSNKVRQKVVKTLYMETELSVTQLCNMIGISQSALSQHLAIMRKSNVVKTRRDAQTIYYSLQGEKAIRIIHIVEGK